MLSSFNMTHFKKFVRILIYSHLQKFKTTCLKFGFLQQVGKIVHLFHHIVFMLEEHCYITDAFITTFKNEVFNNLLLLEKKSAKLMQILLLKMWAKKGLSLWMCIMD